MNEIAGWIAPAATMIAAMMTAANLGARVTGWGFVVFVAGSIAWVIVAATSGQTNLLLTNGFLTLVNVAGVWRWLGREARYGDGGAVAAKRSEARAAPTLFALGSLSGRDVTGSGGESLGAAVDAMLGEKDGTVAYLVVRSGGIGGVGEELRAIGWHEIAGIGDESIAAGLDPAAFRARPVLDPKCWPATAREAGIDG